MQKIRLADKNVVLNFPDGMSDAEISAVIQREYYSGNKQQSQQPQAAVPQYRGVGGSWEEDKPLSILEQRRREQEFGTYKEASDSSAGEELVKGLKQGGYGALSTLGTLAKVAGARDVGQKITDFAEQGVWRNRPDQDVSGNVIDDPGLMADPKWLAHGLGQIAPSIAAAAIPGAAVGKGLQALGAGAKATRYAGVITAGATGGIMEGASTYEDTLRETGDEALALRNGAGMALGSAALNSLSFGKMLSGKTKSKLIHAVTSGLTESTTESLEEPLDAMLQGKDPVNAWLTGGLNVMLPSFILGGAGGMAGGSLSREEKDEIVNALDAVANDKQAAPDQRAAAQSLIDAINAVAQQKWDEAEQQARILNDEPHAEARADTSGGRLKSKLATEQYESEAPQRWWDQVEREAAILADQPHAEARADIGGERLKTALGEIQDKLAAPGETTTPDSMLPIIGQQLEQPGAAVQVEPENWRSTPAFRRTAEQLVDKGMERRTAEPTGLIEAGEGISNERTPDEHARLKSILAEIGGLIRHGEINPEDYNAISGKPAGKTSPVVARALEGVDAPSIQRPGAPNIARPATEQVAEQVAPTSEQVATERPVEQAAESAERAAESQPAAGLSDTDQVLGYNAVHRIIPDEDKAFRAYEYALKSFDPSRGVPFEAYATMVARYRKMDNSVKAADLIVDDSLDRHITEDSTVADVTADRRSLTEDDHLTRMSVDKVREALKDLKPREQQVIQAVYFDGLSYPEAGEQMGMSRQAIKQHHDKALAMLQERFNPAVSNNNQISKSAPVADARAAEPVLSEAPENKTEPFSRRREKGQQSATGKDSLQVEPAQPRPASKQPTGWAWIKGRQLPFTTWREIERGKHAGKIAVNIRGVERVIDPKDVAQWPGGEKAQAKPDPEPVIKEEPETLNKPVEQEAIASQPRDTKPADDQEAVEGESPKPASFESMPGTRVIARRIVNGEERFIASVGEQFGFSRADGEAILGEYKKVGVVKIDPVDGQFKLKDGRFWDKEVMRRALDQSQAEPRRQYQMKKNQSVIDRIASEIEAGEPARRYAIERDGQGSDKEWGVIPSTYPEYFKNKGFTKKQVLNIITKHRNGGKLTELQAAVLDDLIIGKRAEDAGAIREHRARERAIREAERAIREDYPECSYEESSGRIRQSVTDEPRPLDGDSRGREEEHSDIPDPWELSEEELERYYPRDGSSKKTDNTLYSGLAFLEPALNNATASVKESIDLLKSIDRETPAAKLARAKRYMTESVPETMHRLASLVSDYSGMKVFRESPAGQVALELVNTVETTAKAQAGKHDTAYDKANAALTVSERLWVKHEFKRAYEAGEKMPTENIRRYAEAWTKIQNEIGQRNEELEVLIDDPRAHESYKVDKIAELLDIDPDTIKTEPRMRKGEMTEGGNLSKKKLAEFFGVKAADLSTPQRIVEFINQHAGRNAAKVSDIYIPEGKRLFKRSMENTYFPRIMTKRARKAFERGEGELYEAILKAGASDRHDPNSGANLALDDNWMVSMHARTNGALEAARIGFLPDKVTLKTGEVVDVLESDPFVVIPQYIHSTAQRQAIIEHMGQEEATGYANEIFAALKAEGHETEADIWRGMWRTINGEYAKEERQFMDKHGFTGFLNGAEAIARTAMLSASTLAQISGWVPIATRAGALNTVRQIARLSAESAGRRAGVDCITTAELEFAQNLGGFARNTLGHTFETEDLSGFIGAAGDAVLKATGFELSNRKLNQLASLAAMRSFADSIAYLRNPKDNALRALWGKDAAGVRRALQDNYDFTTDQIDRMVDNGMDYHDFMALDIKAQRDPKYRQAMLDVAQAVQKMSAKTNIFNESVVNRPVWMSKRVARMVLAFSSYQRAMGRTRNIAMREATKGNLRPIVTLLVGGAIAGAAQDELKRILFKKGEREPIKDNWDAFSRLVNYEINAATFGMLGGYAQDAMWAIRKNDYGIDVPMVDWWTKNVLGVTKAIKEGEATEAYKTFAKNTPLARLVDAQTEGPLYQSKHGSGSGRAVRRGIPARGSISRSMPTRGGF